jgi:hypothetical protein
MVIQNYIEHLADENRCTAPQDHWTKVGTTEHIKNDINPNPEAIK